MAAIFGDTVTVPSEMVTVATAGLLIPPGPVQVNAKAVVVAVTGPVLWLPLVATDPLQPPDAVQDVALIELHVSVDAPPVTTEGLAVIVAKGTTFTVTAVTALAPPGPVQDIE